MKIIIVPCGKIDEAAQDYLKQELPLRFNLPIKLGEAQAIPQDAYNEKRGQHHSTKILKKVVELKENPKDIILAVVDVDLYVPELNFVFGEADVLRNTSVISTKRLHQAYYGLKEDKRIFLERTLKEAVHEIGHLFELGHCKNSRCVMFFSNSLWDTDRKDSWFCQQCKHLLG